jgi:flagellar motor protein MotB
VKPARTAGRELFPVNVWPPMVDAVTLVLAVFALIALIALVAERGVVARLKEREATLERVEAERARLEQRLKALAATGLVQVDDGKVILQTEVLFASGSDDLLPEARAVLMRLAAPLAQILAGEPDQMVLVGGHTDDLPIHTSRFASNWELSTARATAVARVLVGAGLDPARIVSSGFGSYHPRAGNDSPDGRAANRRIEVLLVPIHSVSSR